MNKSIRLIIILLILSMLSACSTDDNIDLSSPHYNSVTSHIHSHDDTDTTSNDNSHSHIENTEIDHDDEQDVCEIIPIIETNDIISGNSFEQQQYFGFYCEGDDGFYYVNRTGDGFLYHYDNGVKTLVLDEYTRALHYFEEKIYYLKGTKEQFISQEHFYGGNVWCYDTITGEESCVVDGIPNNMCLVVNEYGIFCNPNSGGVAMYDFKGKLVKIFSEKNQNICIFDNFIYLRRDNDCILQNLDDGTIVIIPEMSLIVSYNNGKIIYTNKNNQNLKYIADIKSGYVNALQTSEAYSFVWCDEQLYASDNYNIYRVNLEKFQFEPIITLDIIGPIYIFCLFCDDDKLYAEVVNQSGMSTMAEVMFEDNSLNFLGEA